MQPFIRNEPTVPWRALTAWLALTFSAAVAGNDCDCSCESMRDMQELMQSLEERADQGEMIMPPTELQEMAACAGECAMAWGRCDGDRAGRARPSSPGEGEKERDSTERGDAGDSSDDQPDPEYALGQPREDLERFYGVYGSDDQPGRDFFVARAQNRHMEGREIPPGYLMIGAMWGDVAPWYMQSTGDLRFEQKWTNPGAEPLIVAFETDDQGNAVSMQFLGGFLAERGVVKRTGDLPEGW